VASAALGLSVALSPTLSFAQSDSQASPPMRCTVSQRDFTGAPGGGGLQNFWYCDQSGKPTFLEILEDSDGTQGDILDYAAITSAALGSTISAIARTAHLSFGNIYWSDTNDDVAWDWLPVGPQMYEAHRSMKASAN
jgi:hypothetical protein